MDAHSSPYITHSSSFHFLSVPSFRANQRQSKADTQNSRPEVRGSRGLPSCAKNAARGDLKSRLVFLVVSTEYRMYGLHI